MHLVHQDRARPLALEASAVGDRYRRAPRDGHLRRQRQPGDLQRRQLEPAVRRHGHDRSWSACSATTACCSGTSATRAATACAAGRLPQITHDHSLLQEQIDSGLITAEQAAFSANKNLVTRAVGVEDTVLLETHLHDVMPGDVYLLCSDGLSDMLDDESDRPAVAELRITAGSWRPLCIDAANEAGGKDNISVVLVRVRAPAGPRARGGRFAADARGAAAARRRLAGLRIETRRLEVA